eukprot:jgi/Chlat1/3697/Chrsp249S03840
MVTVGATALPAVSLVRLEVSAFSCGERQWRAEFFDKHKIVPVLRGSGSSFFGESLRGAASISQQDCPLFNVLRAIAIPSFAVFCTPAIVAAAAVGAVASLIMKEEAAAAFDDAPVVHYKSRHNKQDTVRNAFMVSQCVAFDAAFAASVMMLHPVVVAVAAAVGTVTMVDLRCIISSTAGNDSHSGPELAAISKAASGAQSNNQAAGCYPTNAYSREATGIQMLLNRSRLGHISIGIYKLPGGLENKRVFLSYCQRAVTHVQKGFAEGTKVLVVGDPDYVQIAKRDNTSTYDDGHGVSVEWLQISTRIFNQHNAGNAACTSGGNRETRLPELLQSWTYHQIDPDSECDPGSEGLLDCLNDVLPKLQVHHPTED